MKGLALGLMALLHAWRPAPAEASCASPANPIEAENCLPGNPRTEWDTVSKVGDATIQGFATDMSYNRGQTASFKVNTDAPSWRIDVYRLGYYGGMGARKVATIGPLPASPQPACVNDAATGLIDCGNWSASASWPIPADAVSGLYVAKLVRLDNNGASHIVFVVRNDAGSEDLLFETADTTWQAYNPWGGNSLYVGAPSGTGAYKVSYNRPFIVRGNYPTSPFNQEYPVLRWLEANGYNVAYFSNVDTERRGSLIQNHKVFVSVGHQEYWSPVQRANVEAARNAGVHLAFLSSVVSFWKTRWEPSIAGPSTSNRTLVCYKETTRGAIDPQDPPTWTGMWRDKKLSPSSDGGKPENSLSGQSFAVDALRNDNMSVPAEFGRLRFWRNTSVASLGAGQSAVFPQTLGFEWDVDWDNGHRPPGLIRLTSTTVTVPKYLTSGTLYTTGPITHNATLYKHPSGALVFGAGTMHWGWGLDDSHDGGTAPTAQTAMRQATVNLLADMGAQPATLQQGLSPATASSDASPPSSAVTFPPAGAGVGPGATVLISGTAADSGGGVVAAVEVSTNNGASWHPAVGRESWSYSWTVAGQGSVQLRSRAVDDSGNLGPMSPPVALTRGNPTPLISDFDPDSAPLGGGPFVLTVTGMGFSNGSVVRWKGADKPTAFVDSGTLRVTLAAEDLAEEGSFPIVVVAPGGSSSQTQEFEVKRPEPASHEASHVRAFPNPWRADRHAGLPLTFDRLPPQSTIKIFTTSGRWIKTVTAPAGTGTWDLSNDSGDPAASGYYLYVVEDGQGRETRGKLILVR